MNQDNWNKIQKVVQSCTSTKQLDVTLAYMKIGLANKYINPMQYQYLYGILRGIALEKGWILRSQTLEFK